jgi:hypothetical protein
MRLRMKKPTREEQREYLLRSLRAMEKKGLLVSSTGQDGRLYWSKTVKFSEAFPTDFDNQPPKDIPQ